MYDEFGNLKKKFRAKAQQAEAAQSLPGVGRAGWEVEELGMLLYFHILISFLYGWSNSFPFVMDVEIFCGLLLCSLWGTVTVL